MGRPVDSGGVSLKPKRRRRAAPSPPPRSEAASGGGYQLPKSRPEPARRPAPRGSLADPLMRGGAFHHELHQANQRVRRAEQNVSRHAGPTIPGLIRFPKLSSYTSAQRHTILRVQSAALARARAGNSETSIETVMRLGDHQTRQELRQLEKLARTQTFVDNVRAGLQAAGHAGHVTDHDILTAHQQDKTAVVNLAHAGHLARVARENTDVAKPYRPPAKLELAGLPVGAVVEGAVNAAANEFAGTGAEGVIRAAGLAIPETIKETIDHPRQAIKANLGFLRDITLGLPSGVVGTVLHPRQTGKAMLKSYGDFYGPLASGNTGQFRKNVEKTGALKVALDVPVPGALIGKVAGVAAKAGMLGRAAEDVVRTERPMLRYSFGKDAVKRQPGEADKTYPNLGRAVLQNRRDAARAKKSAQRVRDARRYAKDGATRTERTLGTSRSVPALKPRGGAHHGSEVVPRSSTHANFLQVRDVAKRKGHAVHEIRMEQHKTIVAARAALKPLSKWEQKAWVYVHRGLAPADPEKAVAELKARRAAIVAHRKTKNFQPSAFHRDELKTIDGLIAHAEEAFTPAVAKAAKETGGIERAVAGENPALVPVQAELRRYAQQADHLGITRHEGESNDAFLGRVKTAAKDRGLPAPSYFPSEEFFQTQFAPYAAGGTKAAAEYKRYKGRTYKLGREYLHPEVFVQGLARGIKTKVNWNLIADQVDRHAHPDFKDLPIRELKRKLEGSGIDQKDYAIWLPAKFRAKAQELGHDDTIDKQALDGEAPRGVSDAIQESTVPADRLDELAADPKFKNMKATIVPVGAYKEIFAGTKQQGAVGRSLDVTKAKFSRTILGAFNLPWLQANLAANVFTMLLRGATPISVAKAGLWWRKLPEAERADLERELQLSAPKMADLYKPQMGATVNNRMVNGWRAYRRSPWGQKLRPFEKSINAFMRVDVKVNSDAFRKALFHVEAKRTAFRRIDKEAGLANGLLARITSLATVKGPEKQLQALIRSQRDIETHGEKVAHMLGDWETFSAAERNYLGKLFFYPYIRYSLRWAFWTMPVYHPVITQILAQLAHHQADEVRHFLGGDVLPYNLGKVYFEANGKVKSIDLGNLNPAGNAATDLQKPTDLFSFLPPYASLAIGQVMENNTFFNRPWRVEGNTEYTKPPSVSPLEHLRVLAHDLVSMTPVGRELLRQTTHGFQGDDSLPFLPAPTIYKSAAKHKQEQDLIRQQTEGGPFAQLLHHQVPLLPQDSRDKVLTRARARPVKKKRRRRSAGGSSAYGGGGSASAFGGG